MKTFTIEQITDVVKLTPEQACFDWKRDFVVPNDDEKRGEFLKDLSAVANSCPPNRYGFIIYGVDPRRSELVCGINQSYDDAKLQQLVQGKIEPAPEFLYYELPTGKRKVAVVQVAPSVPRPHVISVNMGSVRKGQILVRRGSSTDGATMSDLMTFFYGQHSVHFQNVLQRLNVHANQQSAETAYLRELRAQADQSLRDMENISGVKLR